MVDKMSKKITGYTSIVSQVPPDGTKCSVRQCMDLMADNVQPPSMIDVGKSKTMALENIIETSKQVEKPTGQEVFPCLRRSKETSLLVLFESERSGLCIDPGTTQKEKLSCLDGLRPFDSDHWEQVSDAHKEAENISGKAIQEAHDLLKKYIQYIKRLKGSDFLHPVCPSRYEYHGYTSEQEFFEQANIIASGIMSLDELKELTTISNSVKAFD